MPKTIPKLVIKKLVIKDYKRIASKYKIICNNSVSGGDCFKDTFCDLQCNHQDKLCQNCKFLICGCCYSKCPCCFTS